MECPRCAATLVPGASRCGRCGADVPAGARPPANAAVLPVLREALHRELRRVEADIQRIDGLLGRTQEPDARQQSLRDLDEAQVNREALLDQIAVLEDAVRVPARCPAPGAGTVTATSRTSPAKPEASHVPEPRASSRVPTGVRGLDEALGGGIPAGAVVVIGGAPGTMKSSLACWILAQNGMRDGRRGLYLTLEETPGSLRRQMAGLGIDVDRATGCLRLQDGRPLAASPPPAGDWLTGLRDLVAGDPGGPPALLVLDSLDALRALARFEDPRREVFRLFAWLRDSGTTAFVISERPDLVFQGNVVLGRYEEDFLADGVVNLRMHLVTDQLAQRRIRIVKMRGTRHETGYLALHAEGDGIEVSPILGG